MKALLLFAFLTLPAADNRRERAACHQTCFQCEVRCRGSKDPQACRQTCLELKRQCCEGSGSGPGPHNTCDCT